MLTGLYLGRHRLASFDEVRWVAITALIPVGVLLVILLFTPGENLVPRSAILAAAAYQMVGALAVRYVLRVTGGAAPHRRPPHQGTAAHLRGGRCRIPGDAVAARRHHIGVPAGRLPRRRPRAGPAPPRRPAPRRRPGRRSPRPPSASRQGRCSSPCRRPSTATPWRWPTSASRRDWQSASSRRWPSSSPIPSRSGTSAGSPWPTS